MDTRDPRGLGRIKVLIPSKMGGNTTDWIWPVGGRSSLSLPSAGSQVFVLYEANDPDYPVWLPNTDGLADEIASLKARVAALEGQAHTH